MTESEAIKHQILNLVDEYYQQTQKEKEPFKEGDRVNYSGRVYDHEELMNLVDSSLDFYLTSGKWTDRFENKFKLFQGTSYAHFVNSGSSANLLAFMALTSPELGDFRIKRGDQVITVASCFPTTISPIVNFGAVPVFVDCNLDGNINIEKMKEALSDRTRAVMIAHTLGIPFNVKAVKEFCDENNLWLIEDCADALGSTYDNQLVGTFGHISTFSFFPAHMITSGEGGMVCTDNPLLARIIKSFRDWGRDYKCDKCIPDCKKRFDSGYDCRYEYSTLGYNLKATDLQASIGCAQMDKLEGFIKARKENYQKIFDNLYNLIWTERIQMFSSHIPNMKTDSSYFGFMFLTPERNELAKYLEEHNIEFRYLFAGNITKQKCMQDNEVKWKQVGLLTNTDRIMDEAIWVGVYPGMTEEKIVYMCNTIKEFFEKN